MGASGRRQVSLVWPSRLAAYFTGPGLVSTNIASCSGSRRSCSAIACAGWPAFQAACISLHRRGATLPVTQMQPSPPAARKAIAVWSSPDSCTKSAPQARRVCSGRARFAVASFTPTMFGWRDRRAIVSTLISTTLRPGML